MRLTQAQTERVQGQIDAQALPPDHPTAAQLETIFGGHTFFLGPSGLHVVEPGLASDSFTHAAALVKIATWHDDEKTKLQPQGAVLDGSVDLGDEEDEGDDRFDSWA